MVDRGRTRHRADIEEYADVGLEDGTKGVEEPAMRVDFLLVLFFEAEDDLDGDDASLRTLDLHGGSHGNWRMGLAKKDSNSRVTHFVSCTRIYAPRRVYH